MVDEMHQWNGILKLFQITVAIEAGFAFRYLELVQHPALEGRSKSRAAVHSIVPDCAVSMDGGGPIFDPIKGHQPLILRAPWQASRKSWALGLLRTRTGRTRNFPIGHVNLGAVHGCEGLTKPSTSPCPGTCPLETESAFARALAESK